MSAGPDLVAVPALTGKLAEIAEIAGVAAALILARELGGQELKLSARPGGKLARLVGVEAAAALVEAYGAGQKLTVPMAHLRGAGGRRAAAAALMAGGCSSAQAAARADVHERTARRIRERAAKPLSLFPEE